MASVKGMTMERSFTDPTPTVVPGVNAPAEPSLLDLLEDVRECRLDEAEVSEDGRVARPVSTGLL